MDSDKAKKIGKIILKFAAKKGVKYFLFSVVGTALLPMAGDAAEVVEGVQEIIDLFSGDDHLA